MQQPVQSDTGTKDVTQKRWMKMMHSPMSSQPKLHRWLLILFVGRQENTPVTAVQAVDVVGDALRPAVQLSSSMSTCEQAICVWKVHLLMKDVALSWCKELKAANGKGIKKMF